VPEGDTIHRAAAKLRPVLEGQRLVDCACDLASVQEWQVVGRTVARVEARGKHLLIHCAPLVPVDKPDPRRTEQLTVAIWTHMGMTGRWQVYPAPPPALAHPALALHTETQVAVCFRPEILKLLGPRSLLRNPMLAQLGPDLLDPGVDLDEAVQRLRALGDVALGDAIMRQSAVAGIGNVWKSELLFLARLDPFTPVDALDPAVLRALLERARELMRRNVEQGGPRRTRFAGQPVEREASPHGGRRPSTGGFHGRETNRHMQRGREATGERVWVYERSGRPCHVCGTTIAMRRQGALARSTYYCPRCQAAG
jgi:endonuclease-8